MKIAAIIQARMDSQRFPGKVIREICGKPALQYLVESLRRCDCLDDIVVATSIKPSEKPIIDLCGKIGVKYYRGDLLNVAKRFEEVLNKYDFEAFVRVSGDSPLLDHELVVKAVEIFRKGDFEIVTNVLKRTYPSGESVEILSAEAFRRGYGLMKDPDDLEHVTKYFYKNSGKFKIFNFESSENLSSIDLSLDVENDLGVIDSIVSRMNRPHWEYRAEDVARMYKEALEDSKAG